jgi:multiple sugar transport system substrate-binding protein
MSAKRRNAATAVTAAAVLALGTACSSSSGSTAAPAVTGSASGTITWFANQFGPTSTDVRKTLIAGFEKAYPNIKVNLEQAPSDSDTYRSTLITQISGGSSSFDVYNGDVVWPAQFGKQSLALPLNSYFDSSYWNTFSNGLVTSLTYKGQTYAVPLFTDNAFLFYRKDLLAKAHLPVPTTWEQLQTEAATLQKDNLVKYGFAAQFDSYEGLTCDFTEFAADAGGSTVSADGSKATIDSAADQKALTYMRGLITSGVSPSAITTFQEQQSESLFTAGQVAFLRNWTYAYADSNTADEPADVRRTVGAGLLGDRWLEPVRQPAQQEPGRGRRLPEVDDRKPGADHHRRAGRGDPDRRQRAAGLRGAGHQPGLPDRGEEQAQRPSLVRVAVLAGQRGDLQQRQRGAVRLGEPGLGAVLGQ